MRKSLIKICLLLLTESATAAQDATAQAHYLGNAGIMVVRGNVKVLFDAFYAESHGHYALVPEETQAAILAGEPPYDGVDAVFVSHIHGDHFTAGATLAYLRAQAGVELYGPPRAIAALRDVAAEDASSIASRLHAVDARPGRPPVSVNLGELAIEAFAIPHAGGERMAQIRNLAFRVTLDGAVTVIHLGDADADDRHFVPVHEQLSARRTHAAFPPFWFLETEAGRTVLDRRIRAQLVIGIHVPAQAIGRGDEWRKRAVGDLFTDPGEVRSLATGK